MVDINKEELDDLVERKLVVKKKKGDLNLYKFHNKVFYKGLWNESDQLLEARGLVLDDDGNVVQRPFHKMFNFLENGTKCDRDKKVVGHKKINGFMAAVTCHRGELLVTTTGSFDSPYQQLAESYFEGCYFHEALTYIFEICDPSDPHIIEEEYGVYLLGIRVKETGEYLCPNDYVSTVLGEITIRIPEYTSPKTFDQLRKMNKEAEHEGYVVLDYPTLHPMFKMKSPLYLSKKAMMRVGKNAADQMFDNPKDFKKRIDEEFFGLHDWIISCYNKEEWRTMKEQERRNTIEQYFEWGNGYEQ